MRRIIVIMLLLAGMDVPVLNAQDAGLLPAIGLSAMGDITYNSVYVWRGIMLDGDSVMQNGFYLNTTSLPAGRIKAGVWINHDLSNHDELRSGETDSMVDYTVTVLSGVDLSCGHTYYDFPGINGWSREAYGGLSFSGLFLSPSVFFYYDYGKKAEGGGEGSYTVVNAGYTIPAGDITVENAAHAGFNNKQFYDDTGGDLWYSLAVSFPLTKHIVCKPNVSLSVPWGNVADEDKGDQDTSVYGGVYVSF